MAVKALTFDIIGTVFDWLGSFSNGVVPLAQEYALSIDPATFANDALDGYAGAPAGPMPGEDAIAFDLARIRAEQSAGDWIVTDGTSRLLDFGSGRFNALHAVAVIRNYGFTHQCFVGRPGAPMMYFRK